MPRTCVAHRQLDAFKFSTDPHPPLISHWSKPWYRGPIPTLSSETWSTSTLPLPTLRSVAPAPRYPTTRTSRYRWTGLHLKRSWTTSPTRIRNVRDDWQRYERSSSGATNRVGSPRNESDCYICGPLPLTAVVMPRW